MQTDGPARSRAAPLRVLAHERVVSDAELECHDRHRRPGEVTVELDLPGDRTAGGDLEIETGEPAPIASSLRIAEEEASVPDGGELPGRQGRLRDGPSGIREAEGHDIVQRIDGRRGLEPGLHDEAIVDRQLEADRGSAAAFRHAGAV